MGFIVKHAKRHNMEYQFWFYETGNVVAAISGTGGFAKFADNIHTSFSMPDQSIFEQSMHVIADYPDASVAIGIGALVVLAPLAKKGGDFIGIDNDDFINGTTVSLATGILTYAITQDSSAITVAASAFVVGSSLLRYALKNPFFLKAGGLALAGGAIALSVFGIQNGLEAYPNPETWRAITEAVSNWEAIQAAAEVSLPALTTATGVYVTSASLLTYEGGIYATADWRAEHGHSEAGTSLTSKLTHPTAGWLSRFFECAVDKPVQAINAAAKATILRAIPKDIRDNKPFATSMWARLPWRVMTGAAAALTGNFSFAAANAAWGGGDGMIGLEDYKDKNPPEAAVPAPSA